ncbi:MAG: UvrB/UvrC motif-containing protein [Clostridia bacterium]|nr:UvrB/UvrC motif-containing protein [Clostridia bacterium]
MLDNNSKIEALQNQIKLAVESENYEEAAKLKKEIDKLKQQN